VSQSGGPVGPVRATELDEDECYRLAATQTIGRLGVVVDGEPMVYPMQFGLEGRDIVLRTTEGAKFINAPLTKVCFEVDHVRPTGKEAWSVLFHGVAEDVSTSVDHRSVRARHLAFPSWAQAPADRWLMVLVRSVTGRRLEAETHSA
jgi:nitroimidazol reductase NimA-like FMN-containing flavoprotein (pyridoxamine 5'-phosphate oxidase superfamily)